MSEKLKPCPFCGGNAHFERMGTGRQSCIVECGNCGARHESSDEYDRSGMSWNERAQHAGEALVQVRVTNWKGIKAVNFKVDPDQLARLQEMDGALLYAAAPQHRE